MKQPSAASDTPAPACLLEVKWWLTAETPHSELALAGAVSLSHLPVIKRSTPAAPLLGDWCQLCSARASLRAGMPIPTGVSAVCAHHCPSVYFAFQSAEPIKRQPRSQCLSTLVHPVFGEVSRPLPCSQGLQAMKQLGNCCQTCRWEGWLR